MTNISIQFLGAASTVTGSKFYIQTRSEKIFIQTSEKNVQKSVMEKVEDVEMDNVKE